MTPHNQAILSFLNDYLTMDKPGYAVFLKGNWGCGKTYFIREWMKSLKEEKDEGEDIIALKPAYVSLYGLSSASQIDEAVKREISPWLHGKIAKGGKKILEMVASAALRYSVDLNGDGAKDQMVCTIDPKALMGDDSGHVKGKRIIVFDDLERCQMKIADTLGYINYYVEHAGCNVVIVGDSDKVESTDDFLRIKEKTIGREFQLEPEVDAAIADFVKEIDKDGKLRLADKSPLIKYCFQTAGKNNLRILRQSLSDYRLLMHHLSDKLKSKEAFEGISQSLLANFIVAYAEYKGGETILENFERQLSIETVSRLSSNNGGHEVQPAMRLHEKYERTGMTETHKVLQKGYVETVMNYLHYGIVDEEFLRLEVKRDMKSPWELLGNFQELSNEDVEKYVGLTAGHMEQASFDTIEELLLATCNMLRVLKEGLSKKCKTCDIIQWCLSGLDKRYFAFATNLEDLYHKKGRVSRCLGYYAGESVKEDVKILSSEIERLFQSYAAKSKNALTTLLESLSDERVNDIWTIYGGSIPDGSRPYSMSAIFGQVEPQKFVDGFCALSNKSKVVIIQFVRGHYQQVFNTSNLADFIRDYADDLTVLPSIIALLDAASASNYGVDKINIQALANSLREAELELMKVYQN